MKLAMRSLLLVAMYAFVVAVGMCLSQAADQKRKVIIAVGGVTGQMDKLVYAVALHRGFFKDEGIDVESIDFNSGAKGLEAMIGGSADVTQGGFGHVSELRARGINLVAFAVFNRFPGFVIVIPKSRVGQIKSVADLKGKTIGVSSPGSASQIFVALALKSVGTQLDENSYVATGNGAGAMAALRSGSLDALSNNDPNITALTESGDAVVLADSRTEADVKKYYGGDMAEAGFYAKDEWVNSHPFEAQAIANGMVRAMQWFDHATPEEIASSVPAEYYHGNKKFYEKVVAANIDGFKWSGILTSEAAKNAYDAIKALQPELENKKIDLSKTYTNKFVIEARKKYPQQ